METVRLGGVEGQFADIVWREEPVSSGNLVKLCEQELYWKKSTTYTVLRKFCDRGIFKNEGGRVTALVSRESFYLREARELIEKSFGGSLPRFVAAFAYSERLTPEELEELRRIIAEYEGEAK